MAGSAVNAGLMSALHEPEIFQKGCLCHAEPVNSHDIAMSSNKIIPPTHQKIRRVFMQKAR